MKFTLKNLKAGDKIKYTDYAEGEVLVKIIRDGQTVIYTEEPFEGGSRPIQHRQPTWEFIEMLDQVSACRIK